MLLNVNQPQERIVEKEVEVWKELKGLEDFYEISSYGRVLSKRTNKIVKPALLFNGYLRLQTKIDGVMVRFRVHKAVAEMFVESRRDDQIYVNHIDGDKQNNHYLNLEWCTSSENQRHGRDIGLYKKHTSEGIRKLSNNDVLYIRERYIKGCEHNGSFSLSKLYGVHPTVILNIVNGKTYKDVT